MIDPRNYNISVRYGDFEGETCFEARVREFPDLAEYADSYEEAYQLVLDAIETIAVVFIEKGKDMPLPMEVVDDYSGRVTLRLPKSLHRALAESADGEGISLNQHIVTLLSFNIGVSSGIKRVMSGQWVSVGRFTTRKPAIQGKILNMDEFPISVEKKIA